MLLIHRLTMNILKITLIVININLSHNISLFLLYLDYFDKYCHFSYQVRKIIQIDLLNFIFITLLAVKES